MIQVDDRENAQNHLKCISLRVHSKVERGIAKCVVSFVNIEAHLGSRVWPAANDERNVVLNHVSLGPESVYARSVA